jgi:hypothetical protein
VVDDAVEEAENLIKPTKELAESTSYKKIQQSIDADIVRLKNDLKTAS